MEVKFECTKCGKCCTGPSAVGPRLSEVDFKRLLAKLGSYDMQRAVKRHGDGAPQIRMHQGRCVFLQSDNRCGVYEERPDQCRSFPFWSVLWVKPGDWKHARCEGLTVDGEKCT